MKINEVKPKIESIQILRALAAFIVILHHSSWAFDSFSKTSGFIQRSGLGKLGASGVDIFFVISGFIMFYTQSNSKKENRITYALNFLKNRILRIYPLYWIWTIMLLVMWYLKLALTTHTLTIICVIASFLLIPYPQPDGNLHPFLDQGWTLSFEMYFYFIFAFGLICTYSRIKVAIIVVLSLSIISLIAYSFSAPLPVQYITGNSLIIEFIFGGLIVFLVENIDMKFFKYGTYIFLIGSILMIANVFYNTPINNRAIKYGIPAFLIVLGAVISERNKPFKHTYLYKLGLFLGNASYSIYLTHVFFIMFLGAMLKKGHFVNLPADFVIITSSIIITLICSLSYIIIERPLTGGIKLLTKKAN